MDVEADRRRRDFEIRIKHRNTSFYVLRNATVGFGVALSVAFIDTSEGPPIKALTTSIAVALR